MPNTSTNVKVVDMIAAEVRFVEQGHNVRLDTARHCFLVKSDSRPGLTYEVTVVAAHGEMLRGSCTCPAGRHARHGVSVTCKHVAGVMRRLEREGLARFTSGRWAATPRLMAAVA